MLCDGKGLTRGTVCQEDLFFSCHFDQFFSSSFLSSRHPGPKARKLRGGGQHALSPLVQHLHRGPDQLVSTNSLQSVNHKLEQNPSHCALAWENLPYFSINWKNMDTFYPLSVSGQAHHAQHKAAKKQQPP